MYGLSSVTIVEVVDNDKRIFRVRNAQNDKFLGERLNLQEALAFAQGLIDTEIPVQQITLELIKGTSCFDPKNPRVNAAFKEGRMKK